MSKYTKEIVIAAFAVLLIVSGCLVCNNVQLRHENVILNQGISDRDSIIEREEEYIMTITYQHEDDEAFMKEKEEQ